MANIEEDKNELRGADWKSSENRDDCDKISHPCGACALKSCWYSKGECLTMFPRAPAREISKKGKKQTTEII